MDCADTFFILESLDWYGNGFSTLGPYSSVDQVVDIMQLFVDLQPLKDSGPIEVLMHEVIVDTRYMKKLETIKTMKYRLEHGKWGKCI